MTLELLVFGHSGQVAQALRRTTREGVRIHTVPRQVADLRDPDRCRQIVLETTAHAVINAAALRRADLPRAGLEQALRINAQTPAALAAVAARRGLPFLHLSTSDVFDGNGSRPWTEQDQPAPATPYAQSKRQGELSVLGAAGLSSVVRTSHIFSERGDVGQLLARAGRVHRFNAEADIWAGPTAANDLADVLIRMAAALCAGRGRPGLYHFCGHPYTTPAGFAREMLSQAALRTEVIPVKARDWPGTIDRPENGCLNCQRLERAFGIRSPDWRVSLWRMMSAHKEVAA